jgi:hypothetical protein
VSIFSRPRRSAQAREFRPSAFAAYEQVPRARKIGIHDDLVTRNGQCDHLSRDWARAAVLFFHVGRVHEHVATDAAAKFARIQTSVSAPKPGGRWMRSSAPMSGRRRQVTELSGART